MKDIDLDFITDQIAKTILEEELGQSGEKEKQSAVVDQIEDRDLKAKEKEGSSKTLTDEAEDEDEEKEGKDEEEKDIKPKPKPEAENEDEEDKEGFEVKSDEEIPDDIDFDTIKKQINNLRAGGSLKDENVSSQLEDYFDKLGSADTRALYVYLSSVASILTGGTPGVDAPRPEDADIDLQMVKKEKPEEKSPIPGVSGETGEQAPIVVGEIADNTSAKMRILEGLSSSDDHRCMNGKTVKFGSPKCVSDLQSRIEDAMAQRDACSRGTADRVSLNGILNFLRQKLRLAQKVSMS